jgi:hypothetical protein
VVEAGRARVEREFAVQSVVRRLKTLLEFPENAEARHPST